MGEVECLTADRGFRAQATRFARWYQQERRAVLEVGKIAADWLERYSRGRNADRFAEALRQVTGLRVTGRTIRYYRDIFLMYQSWSHQPRRGAAKSGNDFHNSHVGPGHLRVAAAARVPAIVKHRLLDEAERRLLTVKQTTARARQLEVEANRTRRKVRLRAGDPQVIQGDALTVVARLKPASIHHLFLDWQWQTCGEWQDVARSVSVHRPADPVGHLCRFLRAARPRMSPQCIVWIFSKTTAFEGGEIGLPWDVQRTARELGLRYCSEYIAVHPLAGYRSKSSFLGIKHLPIHPFVPEGFDFAPVTYMTSVGRPRRSASPAYQATIGATKHPYQKPVELFEDLLRVGTPAGLVFDAFAGSGMAGVAAVRGGYPYVGAEIEPRYVHFANRALALALVARDDSAQSA